MQRTTAGGQIRLLTMVLAAALVALLAVPALTLAHVERTAYWPDPRPDTSVTPAAGGAVPKARSLASALDRKQPGTTRVVCQPDSLRQLRAEVGLARRDGVDLRPTQIVPFSKKQSRSLLAINQ